jgi:hypothetical protein
MLQTKKKALMKKRLQKIQLRMPPMMLTRKKKAQKIQLRMPPMMPKRKQMKLTNQFN